MDTKSENDNLQNEPGYILFMKEHRETLLHLDGKERMIILHKAWKIISSKINSQYELSCEEKELKTE